MRFSLTTFRYPAAPLLLVALLLGACQSSPDGDAPVDGAEVLTTAVAAEDGTVAEPDAPAGGEAATAESAPMATVVPEPTVSESARMATEIALRDRPTYLRSIGTNGFGDGTFQLPSALAVDDAGLLYVLDTTGVQVFNREGGFLSRFGDSAIAGAQALTVAPDGSRIYVGVRPGPGSVGADGVAIVVLDSEGVPVARIGQPGSEPGQLGSPAALAIGPSGDLFVADSANQRIEVFAANGTHLRTIGEPGEGRGQLSSPRAMGFGPNGELYVGQGDNFLVQRFNADGSYADTFGHGQSDETLFRIGGIAIGPGGRAYLTRAANHYVQIFDLAEDFWISDFGTLGRGPAEFNTPLDAVVRDNELLIVDQQNHRIQVFRLPETSD